MDVFARLLLMLKDVSFFVQYCFTPPPNIVLQVRTFIDVEVLPVWSNLPLKSMSHKFTLYSRENYSFSLFQVT